MFNQHGQATIDWVMCPLVEFDPLKLSGTPVLKGTRLPADVIVENYLGGSPVEEIEENFRVPQPTIRAILRYAAQQDPDVEL